MHTIVAKCCDQIPYCVPVVTRCPEMLQIPRTNECLSISNDFSSIFFLSTQDGDENCHNQYSILCIEFIFCAWKTGMGGKGSEHANNKKKTTRNYFKSNKLIVVITRRCWFVKMWHLMSRLVFLVKSPACLNPSLLCTPVYHCIVSVYFINIFAHRVQYHFLSQCARDVKPAWASFEWISFFFFLI